MKLQLPGHEHNYIEVEGCNGKGQLKVSQQHTYEIISHPLNTTQLLQLVNMLLDCLLPEGTSDGG